jgi:carbamoyl-phosphate synthase large subunit
MNKEVRIGVTGLGAPLGQSITQACQLSKRNYQIFGFDINLEAAGIFEDVTFIQSPCYTDPDYLNKFSNLLKQYKLDLLFFGSEKEILNASQHLTDWRDLSECKIAVGPYEPYEIGTDKYNTAKFLENNNFPFAHTILLNESSLEQLQDFVTQVPFPLIVKGKRSGPIYLAEDWDDILYFRRKYKNSILQEFLGDSQNAQEITIGAFYTPEYKLTDLIIFERELKYGLSWRCKRIRNTHISNQVSEVLEVLQPTGSINIQMRHHKENFVIHELNMRCSSTTAFRALCGWNEIDMAVDYFVLGQQPKIPQDLEEGRGVRFFTQKWLQDK